jgi:hypothetical protein
LSRVRSLMISRSNWANDNRTLSISRPTALEVLNCCVTETNDTWYFAGQDLPGVDGPSGEGCMRGSRISGVRRDGAAASGPVTSFMGESQAKMVTFLYERGTIGSFVVWENGPAKCVMDVGMSDWSMSRNAAKRWGKPSFHSTPRRHGRPSLRPKGRSHSGCTPETCHAMLFS